MLMKINNNFLSSVNEGKTIYIDVLCLESAYKLLSINESDISKIFYCQKTSFFPYWLLKHIEKKTKAKIELFENVALADTYIDGVSAYEVMQDDIRELLNRQSDLWIEIEPVKKYIKKLNYNRFKIRAYLEQKAYVFLHRVIELVTLARAISKDNYIVIACNNPLSYLAKQKAKENIFFYNNHLSRFLSTSERATHHYDSHNNAVNKYSTLKTKLNIYKQFYYYLARTLLGWFSNLKLQDYDEIQVGSEQILSIIRDDEPHDLFWMKSGKVNPESVWNMEDVELDEKSKNVLKKYGVNRVRVNPSLSKLFSYLITPRKRNVRFVVPNFSFYVRYILNAFLLRNCFEKIKDKWISSELKLFLWREMYWRELYSNVGLKVIWSNRDIDPDSLCRAQAIESIGGYYTGTHWSLYPMNMVPVQKLYDIFFVWGSYFSEELITRNNFPLSLQVEVGYPSGHYFESHRKYATKLRNELKGKVIVSYMDNNSGDDFEASKAMQISILHMLMKLLEKNDDLVVLLKPKRQEEMNMLLTNIPSLNGFISRGKVKVYLGKSHGRRYVPALIGMVSDITIGLGLSTAAVECYLSGSHVMHANLAKFTGESFVEKGKGKVIFDDIQDLNEKLDCSIENIRNNCYPNKDEIFNIYSSLDGFQDGKSYMRIGEHISTIQKVLKNSESRDLATRKLLELLV